MQQMPHEWTAVDPMRVVDITEVGCSSYPEPTVFAGVSPRVGPEPRQADPTVTPPRLKVRGWARIGPGLATPRTRE